MTSHHLKIFWHTLGNMNKYEMIKGIHFFLNTCFTHTALYTCLLSVMSDLLFHLKDGLWQILEIQDWKGIPTHTGQTSTNAVDYIQYFVHWETRWTYSSLMIPPLFGKQDVGIWRVKKHFPWYGYLYKACDQISDFCHQ
jgi:hypothetical protein